MRSYAKQIVYDHEVKDSLHSPAESVHTSTKTVPFTIKQEEVEKLQKVLFILFWLPGLTFE
jgi:hypothetical protein